MDYDPKKSTSKSEFHTRKSFICQCRNEHLHKGKQIQPLHLAIVARR